MNDKDDYIFYLKLNKELPSEYIALDQTFKQSKKSLIPIGLKALLECTKKYQKIHVVIVVRNYQEYKYYVKNVKKILAYFMRTERVHLYIASSFAAVNDPGIMKRDYYNFTKLPVQLNSFCDVVSKMVDISGVQTHHWPGGKRPRMTLAG